MATPQTGIFALGNLSHTYLELDAARPGEGRGPGRRRGRPLRAAHHDGRREPGGRVPAGAVAHRRPRPLARGPARVRRAGRRRSRTSRCRPPSATSFVWIAAGSYDVVFDAVIGVLAALARAGRPGRGDRELVLPPRPRPDRLRRRQREPLPARGPPEGAGARRLARRRRLGAAAAEVGARRGRLERARARSGRSR